MTVSIDRVSVRIPAELAGRADRIVRLVAAELPGLVPAGSALIESITVPAVTVDPRHPDEVVAHTIARALATEIGRVR